MEMFFMVWKTAGKKKPKRRKKPEYGGKNGKTAKKQNENGKIKGVRAIFSPVRLAKYPNIGQCDLEKEREIEEHFFRIREACSLVMTPFSRAPGPYDVFRIMGGLTVREKMAKIDPTSLGSI